MLKVVLLLLPAATIFAVAVVTSIASRGALRYNFAASAQHLQRSPNGAGFANAAKAQSANYVLSAVKGMDPQAVAIYVRSWRRFSPDSRLVVFVDAGTRHPALEEFGVDIIPFNLPEDTVIHQYR